MTNEAVATTAAAAPAAAPATAPPAVKTVPAKKIVPKAAAKKVAAKKAPAPAAKKAAPAPTVPGAVVVPFNKKAAFPLPATKKAGFVPTAAKKAPPVAAKKTAPPAAKKTAPPVAAKKAAVKKAAFVPTAAAKKAPPVATERKRVDLSKPTRYIDPRLIDRKKGFNPRIDFGEIEELAKSIRTNGQLTPMRVMPNDKPGRYTLIDGDRRLTAIELLLKQDPQALPNGVEVKLVSKDQEEIDSLIQMFESNSGKPFLPMEEATAYHRMHAAGMTLKEICERVGRKMSHVQTTLALFISDPAVQEAVKEGTVKASVARDIAFVAKGDAVKQKELIRKAATAPKTKQGREQIQSAIEKTRRERAAAKGKTLTARALNSAELADLGSKVMDSLLAKMADVGLAADANLLEWVKSGNDDEQKVAYMFGVLHGLQAAAGADATLTMD